MSSLKYLRISGERESYPSANAVVFIGGGPPVWAAYARYVRHWDVTRLPYDGHADRWFDPAWLVAAGP